ncbi:hypothetical protein NDU88_005752 [Pleurodeles waltl]|uniref:Uncharacterized protein n=1 Tax=Pleurodeles waltl TaxID=8319 RepID=A0AAV7LQF1_PLEWA|nr:hypothetical protein NDU88_005752 [Pleurodeles waltl]
MWPAGRPPAVERRSSLACGAGSFEPRRCPKGLPPPPGPVRLEKGKRPRGLSLRPTGPPPAAASAFRALWLLPCPRGRPPLLRCPPSLPTVSRCFSSRVTHAAENCLAGLKLQTPYLLIK